MEERSRLSHPPPALIPHLPIKLLHRARSPAHWIAALTALVGAGLLLYCEWTARPLWVDEEMLLLNVRDRGFAGLAGPLWLDQSAPLGWLALERLVLLTLGSGERAVRLVTVLFGMATLATAVWIGRRWMTPVGAAILALLCSIGQWMVFFTLELKHYSADMFLAMLLPALGAWALEAEDGSNGLKRRITVWWTVAVIGQWFGNGALFVTPGCAVVLFVECWRRGWRAASWNAVAGFVWLASFGLLYLLVLRHALGNAYLQNYWSFAFPPASAGVIGTLGWLLGQFEPFAVKPAGTSLGGMFWLASAAGIVLAIATTRRGLASRGDFQPGLLGLMVGTVPLSAAVLAVLHLVPTFERLALWVVPALYVGVGLCADASLSLASPPAPAPATAGRKDRRGRLALAVVAAVGAGAVCVDIFQQGTAALSARPQSNYGLDDRRSVRWLMTMRQPGDALMTTHFGLAALWWYGRLDISGPLRGGSLRDGTPIFEVGHLPPGRDCDQAAERMNAALNGHARVLVYLGFRLNVEAPGFDRLVLEHLGRRGSLVGYQPYAEESRVAIFDLGKAPLKKVTIPLAPGEHPAEMPAAIGCLAIKPASRW
jgi:hypothetical protein